MKYDIAPINETYRGMERALTAADLLNSKTKKIYKDLLEKHFLYLEYGEEVSETAFEKMLVYYQEVITYDISCEIIAYDVVPLDNLYGYSLQLLGIDIVHDMCESLISEGVNLHVRGLINENGLCDTVDSVNEIIPYQDHGGVEWKPCYVYKVILSKDSQQ